MIDRYKFPIMRNIRWISDRFNSWLQLCLETRLYYRFVYFSEFSSSYSDMIKTKKSDPKRKYLFEIIFLLFNLRDDACGVVQVHLKTVSANCVLTFQHLILLTEISRIFHIMLL